MLSKAEKDYLIDLLEKGESIPDEFKYKLFPVAHKEYELAYAGKMRREDLLADEDGSFAVPLQIEKIFGGSDHPEHEDGWHNMAVFGDNLQFLKTVYKNEDPLIHNKIKGKVKLIYIDPPFATSDDFEGKEGAKAYTDKKKGAEFIEYLRKRLILAKEILAEDGSIYVHLDSKMGHYIRHVTWTIDEVIDKLFEEFEQREWEGKTLKLGEDEYTQNALPPRKTIEDIVRLSMKKRGNYGEEMIETNVHKVLSAFTPLLRKNKKSVSSKSVANDMFDISTKVLTKQSTSVGMLRQDRTVLLTNNWEQEILDGEQKEIISEVLEDESLPKSSSKEIDYCLFKTPVTTVITASKPERRFVEMLCKRENADLLTAWIKSRDRGFYEIEYTCRYGSGDSKSRRYRHDKFNPDFFLKATKDNMTYFLVIEIKDDNDDCEENKAKYKYAVQHFAELNGRLERQGIPERYIFHFLSPNAYDVFFQHLRDGTVLEGQGRFRCALENLLEDTQPMP